MSWRKRPVAGPEWHWFGAGRLTLAAVALAFGGVAIAGARQDERGVATVPSAAVADAAAGRPLPQLKTHAPPGFRLYRPGYRRADTGALVSVQLCRLPGWAAPSPQRLRVERLDPAGQLSESHERYLPRLGMRTGNNCRTAMLHLDAVPDYGETIRICAITGRASCS